MSLKVSYDEIRREVGRFLGFDRDFDQWDETQAQDVEDIIKSGQRHFYWPLVADNETYIWSFLCVSVQMELTSGTSHYRLPDDFIRPLSAFAFAAESEEIRLAIVTDHELRSMQSKGAPRGTPRYASIRSKNDKTDEGYEMLVYPTPDRALVLDYRYEREPEFIGVSNPYHMGSAVHSELLISACLMVADKMLNAEAISPDGGVHAQRFFRQLPTSVMIDMEALGAKLT